jgi:uncharacterized glyoxalase superfamily protein PhnB
MSDVKPIPDGCTGIIPHLVCGDASRAISFYQVAFGAEELSRSPAPDGRRIMHASLRIGEQVLYLNDDFPEWSGGPRDPRSLGGSPVVLHQFVTDVDAAVARAEKAGAKVVMAAMDMFWGDRYAVVEDPEGHQWSLATHIRDATPEEIAEAAKKAFGG